MKSIILYGIKTCGSVRKATALFEEYKTPFDFIDLKTHTPSQEQLAQWIKTKGIRVVLNTKSTTYKTLKKELKIPDSIMTESKEDSVPNLQNQIALLSDYPMLIKRPIITSGDVLIVGYEYESIMTLIQSVQKQNKV